MGLKDEIEAYAETGASLDSGEIELWDHVVFPNVIRERQVRLVLDIFERTLPHRTLDLGCGGGWLTKILLAERYDTVGIDASSSLVDCAKEVCGEDSFVVGDCERLPFGDGVFDCITGSAILHHLDADQALSECYRVVSPDGTLLLMEPNKLNPIAALGRRVTSFRTKGESPFRPRSLEKALKRAGWTVLDIRCLFPYSFSLSYLLKILGIGDSQRLRTICPLIEKTERILEKVPLFNRLSYLIYVVAKKG